MVSNKSPLALAAEMVETLLSAAVEGNSVLDIAPQFSNVGQTRYIIDFHFMLVDYSRQLLFLICMIYSYVANISEWESYNLHELLHVS